MKNIMKKVIKLTFVAAFVAVAGYGVYTNQTSNVMSDLALANVEALARGESDEGVAKVDKITTEYIDKNTGEKRTVITIICDGVGPLDCA